MIEPYYSDDAMTLLQGKAEDVLPTLSAGSVDSVITSPPYYNLRDYGVEGQLGLEDTPEEYVANTVAIFREVYRVLADDGTLWLNIGDSYATTGGHASHGKNSIIPASYHAAQNAAATRNKSGLPLKNLIGIPWRVALALQADGWILRNAIVWEKTNPMPESVTDRLSATYEPVFLFTKRSRYWFDKNAAGGSGDVWSVPTRAYSGAHYAPMPLQLARRSILAGCKPGGVVLDPFCGTGTSLLAAQQSGRRGVGIDLNPDYLKLALQRCQQAPLAFNEGESVSRE